MLTRPAANRVYGEQAAALATAELAICLSTAEDIKLAQIAGLEYVSFDLAKLSPGELQIIAEQSTCYALFRRDGGALRPIELPDPFLFSDDLVTIPKYQGKTNEQFTRLLLNVTLAAVSRPATGPRRILDPLAGRGTTLATALLSGHHGYGIERDVKAFEQQAAFIKTYLRRKHIKHSAELSPLRREGKTIGKRFTASINSAAGPLTLDTMTGDATDSPRLFGKRKFDAIITDAPYGVAHAATANGGRSRSPGDLLRAAIPGWAEQLMHGGALGISWNTYGITRDDLGELLTASGLQVATSEPWLGFAHRVDSSIRRDLIVATKP